MLRRLHDVDCVPQLLDHCVVWEHHFLVEEYVEGETLLQAIISRHPLVHAAPAREELAAYADWVGNVVAMVEAALRDVHTRGIHFGDLHPGNVLLRPDGRVALVDWEYARDLGDVSARRFGAPGFVAPEDLTGGVAADEHALDCLRLMALVPLVPLLGLDRGKGRTLSDVACREFPLTRGTRRRLRSVRWGSGEGDAAGALFTRAALDWPTIRDSLVSGIHASVTPERDDRLFPGDPLQFSSGGATLAFGAAGVLLALAEVEGKCRKPTSIGWMPPQSVPSRPPDEGCTTACMAWLSSSIGWGGASERSRSCTAPGTGRTFAPRACSAAAPASRSTCCILPARPTTTRCVARPSVSATISPPASPVESRKRTSPAS